MPKHMSVYGIYSDRPTVSDAIEILRGAGYRITDNSVLPHQNESDKEPKREMSSRASEGAAMGAAVGAAIGAALAWLSATDDLAVWSLRPFVDAGPAIAAFAGAGCAGAIGWLIGLLAGKRRRRGGEKV